MYSNVISDFNETVYIKGDGNTVPATPEDIITLSRRKFGVDNETTEVQFMRNDWKYYVDLCCEYRKDGEIPSIKTLQSEEIVSKEGFVKTGFLMFKDDYDRDDTLICCRLWRGKSKSGIVLDSDRFKGSLALVFKNTMNFIERNIKTGWKKTKSGGRQEIRAYPKAAIREALVNAIAHRDYSINGTQIDVDIYDDRMDIVSPGSWLLPRKYEEYPIGSIPSIRRNTIISACFDVANLMERGGTGFQTMVDSYDDYAEEKQPGVLIYPGYIDLRLFDVLYGEADGDTAASNEEIVLELLYEGPKRVRELQMATKYKSRAQFLTEVINPLIESGRVFRDGNPKSPASLIKVRA